MTLRFGVAMVAVTRCDLLERDGEALVLENDAVTFQLGPFETASMSPIMRSPAGRYGVECRVRRAGAMAPQPTLRPAPASVFLLFSSSVTDSPLIGLEKR